MFNRFEQSNNVASRFGSPCVYFFGPSFRLVFIYLLRILVFFYSVVGVECLVIARQHTDTRY